MPSCNTARPFPLDDGCFFTLLPSLAFPGQHDTVREEDIKLWLELPEELRTHVRNCSMQALGTEAGKSSAARVRSGPKTRRERERRDRERRKKERRETKGQGKKRKKKAGKRKKEREKKAKKKGKHDTLRKTSRKKCRTERPQLDADIQDDNR